MASEYALALPPMHNLKPRYIHTASLVGALMNSRSERFVFDGAVQRTVTKVKNAHIANQSVSQSNRNPHLRTH